ncbi:MAG: hypothetical protein IJI87_03440 [Mogibacterium sp.]|nr:hypothetical protein [Mogibacterium sp.]
MTKVMKKLSAFLLTLALIATMMPILAVPVLAEDDEAFGLAINGKEVSASITVQQLKEDAVGPQVFPFPSSQGKEWKYAVADGASYEGVLKKLTGLESLDKLMGDSAIRFFLGDEEQGKFDLKISDLMNMTKQFKLVDQNGEDITGAFNGEEITSAEAVAIDAPELTPIVAYKYHMYSTYEEATAALGDGSWETDATENVRPFVGGDLTKETFLKKDGAIKMGMLNFTGKFSIVIGTDYKLNIKDYPIELPELAEFANVKMTEGDAAMPFSSSLYTVAEADYLGGVWECDDAEVVSVDQSGNVTPLKAGTTKVSLVAYPDGDPNNGVVLGEWTVTVAGKAAPAPAVADGQTAAVGGNNYTVVSAGAKTAAFTKAANKSSATVPATVSVNGVTLKVTKIAPNAFKGTKVKTLTVKSKALTKASVKNSLKGSKVKTVKVKVGSKKEKKKYVKKYKKIFTKKNAGKKVTVK